MAIEERRLRDAAETAEERRAWEPMAITRIGTFADVMQGATGKANDPGASKKP
jgi:hypothetical protein